MKPKHSERINLLCNKISNKFFYKLLTYKDFKVDKRIIFTSYCRAENQTVIASRNIVIITENKAVFKQIKLVEESYDLCDEKYEDSIAQKKI